MNKNISSLSLNNNESILESPCSIDEELPYNESNIITSHCGI